MVAPTGDPPQKWGVGGEIVIHRSTDAGTTWDRIKQVTGSSPLNHSCVRRPEDHKAPFCYFWATGP